jgi:ATP-binding protein involved in chromosome partitioning
MINKEDILQALREVHHPARQDRDIVDLGMVANVEILPGEQAGGSGGNAPRHDAEGSVTTTAVVVTLAFPKRRDPLAEYLIGSSRAALIRHLPSSVSSEVKTVVVDEDKPKKKKTLDLGLEQLAEVRHIIGVASGKGGVGKSTVAVNLACALARLGYKVGLADADVYGPSVPVMTGTEGATPAAEPGEEEGKELIIPLEKYGVKWMSIGYFASRGQALIWRGPMACNALKQMILQVKWGPLDFLLIDMPPGTGDIHISLVQDIPMEGAVIVTTPQAVALADVEKGVNMFRNENVNRPIFGLIENMAWFTPEEHPDEKYYIFGRDGGAEMAKELGVDLLGRIPLVQGIRESGDAGEPVALGGRPDGLAFIELAGRLAEKLG